MLEVLALGLALERLHGGLVEPVGEEDAAVRGRQLVRLPFLEVVLVVRPLIEQLPKVDFDLAPHAAINRLHLVGLVGRHTHKEPCTKIARAGACSFLPISQ